MKTPFISKNESERNQLQYHFFLYKPLEKIIFVEVCFTSSFECWFMAISFNVNAKTNRQYPIGSSFSIL
ncbi:MAG: hypothetical protein CFE24_01875 [Flavobacterium sp. BFFFF2]|nr:MAG: hypothetical protein CFE24_01875 [Flavobacterium sp. BFFFF2]